MRRNRILCLLIVIGMAVLACAPAYALKASTLRRGSKGENVRLLQQALIGTGYLAGKADGKFGPMTEDAVIRFQKANNLTADGLAGTKTLSLLLGGHAVQRHDGGLGLCPGQHAHGTGAFKPKQLSKPECACKREREIQN